MNDVVDPLIVQQAQQRALEHAEWKRRQAIQPSAGTLLEQTLPERINRLNPSERHQLSTMLRGMKLRKIVRRTLAEAFWRGEQKKALEALRLDEYGTMSRLRAAVRPHESMKSYKRALTSFEPAYTRSTYGDGNDSPAVTRALEQSLLVQR